MVRAELTWDCTVIDDSQDASGEGLMQIVGLERPADQRNTEADQERLEGTTSRDVPAGFWQRYVEHQRRPTRRACGWFTFRWPRCRSSASGNG